jgi:hypothetical protein
MARKRKIKGGLKMLRNSKVRIALIAAVILLVAGVGVFISCGKQIQEAVMPQPLTFTSSSVTPTSDWIKQYGTANGDSVYGICRDASGGIYIAGESQTGWDGYLQKLDPDGNQLWWKSIRTPTLPQKRDYLRAVCKASSGIYVAGHTYGAFSGHTNAGSTDVYLRKYDFNGNLLWTRQYGSTGADYAFGVSSDFSGVYVAGITYGTLPGQSRLGSSDAILIKYDHNGNQRWAKQFGTTGSDNAHAVHANPSAIYVAGYTFGILPGETRKGMDDIFVVKFNRSGQTIWGKQYGTTRSDRAYTMTGDPSGNVYVAGHTYTNRGDADIYSIKLNSSGTLLWPIQYGTTANDFCRGISVYSSKVYLTGYTYGTLPGETRQGHFDAFLISYDTAGNHAWDMQLGTIKRDEGQGVVADFAAVYVAGNTLGVFRAKFLTAHIEFPEGYSVNDINVSTVLLNGVPAELKPTQIEDFDNDGIPDRMVKFNRVSVQNTLSPGAAVEVKITGQFNGKAFIGTDTVRVLAR